MNCRANWIRLWIVVVACGDLVDPDPLGHELFEVRYHLLPNRNRSWFAAFPLTLDVTIEKRFELRNSKLFGNRLWFDQPLWRNLPE